MENIAHIIKRPLVTEKSSLLNDISSESLVSRSVAVFEVSKDASKVQIKRAVEKLFSVKVDVVRTLILPKRRKRVGRFVGLKPAWKKAIVTLSEGSKIDFFEGV